MLEMLSLPYETTIHIRVTRLGTPYVYNYTINNDNPGVTLFNNSQLLGMLAFRSRGTSGSTQVTLSICNVYQESFSF